MKRYTGIRSYLCSCALILIALLLLYSCSAKNENKSADSAVMEQKEIVRMDSIALAEPPPVAASEDLGLEAEELDKEQLDVFVERAKQKLDDLSDYVIIITDKSYNKEFRNEARKQALELFGDTISAADTIEYPYIDSLYASGKKTHIKFTDIVVSQFPERVNDTLYIGKLAFHTSINGLPADHPSRSTIIIKKVPKSFGNETHEVWEVKLGPIKGTGS